MESPIRRATIAAGTGHRLSSGHCAMHLTTGCSRTDVRAFAVALTLGSLFAVGCATGPTAVIAPGPWGGWHVRMSVTSVEGRLESDCAGGVIEEPLRPDGEGRFTASGTHTPGHGGPIRDGEILPSFRARYDGRVKGEQMSL